MNDLSESTQHTVFNPLPAVGKYLFAVLTATVVLCTVAWADSAE